MVGAPVPVPAPAIDYKLTYRINSSIINNSSRKLPPTGTGVPIGAPLKLKLKNNSFVLVTGVPIGAPLKLKLKNNSFVLVFRTPIFQKLRTRNWISYGKSSSDNLNFNRGMRNLNWFRCFDIPWSWTSQMISIYLLCLNFVVEAHETPYSSSGYACENVQNYYAGMENLRGEALKKKLNSIVAKHQSLSYKKVWDALKILDAADVDNPEASAEIVEIYSLRIVSKLLAGKPEGWNREHLWPRSYGLINGPSLTDLHNIRPANVNVNSSRRNKFYGECNVNTSDCLKPAARESAPDTVADREKWAPPVQVRGDIARSIMYMAVCYGFNQSGGGLHLHLSDSPSIVNREMGMLSTLLKWNEVDPPSREEKLRNERICIKYQHNRNPFVDHPEYANLIWKQVI